MKRASASVICFCCYLGLGCLPGSAAGGIARLNVFPSDIHLQTALARQQIIVVATRPDGVTEEVTARATITPPDPKLARMQGSTLYPVADGQTALRAAYDGRTATATVSVKAARSGRAISFKMDVMPIFMRAGCNTGACHGSARGKDGFRLSLFGFDPQGDYFRLTREIGFRRLDLAVPEESLVLQKPTGAVPHSGGKRFDPSGEYYKTLLAWIQAGAANDSGPVPAVESIELFPRQVVLEGRGTRQQMIVRARYADGSERDVTSLAAFYSNNDNSALVTPDGVVAAANRGEAFVLTRFDAKTVGSQAIVLPGGLRYAPPSDPPANYIDQHVNAKLRKVRILSSGICSDAVFLRRATVDIIGQLPTEEDRRAFLADFSADKRAKLVDRLLRKEFAEIWALEWAQLLMIKSTPAVSYKSTYLYSTWLTEQIAKNVPIDRIVRELVAASGGTFSNPATNFYQIETDTLKTAENVAQVFMGARIQCSQCHNHPFDRWTMDDYYSFAAFFSQIGRKEGEDYRETIVFNRGSGEVNHPVGGRVMAPKFLGGPLADCAGRDRRQVVAQWLTAPENPFFAASVSNRIWGHFYGQGIVEPVDDVRVSNPPSNPELLAALAKKLVEYHYDFKNLVRDICFSHTYQRATQTNPSNESDQRNFAHAHVRRIPAEVLLDCVSQVTETKDKFQGLPLGARAVQIADGATTDYFLTTFGRSPRETVCACDVRTEPTLSQALHLLNGETVHNKIRTGNLVRRLLDAKQSPEEVVKDLYLRCLTREPTPEELAMVKKTWQGQANPQEVLEDVFWALLNAREFCFQH